MPDNFNVYIRRSSDIWILDLHVNGNWKTQVFGESLHVAMDKMKEKIEAWICSPWEVTSG